MDIKNFSIYPKDINLFVGMQSKVCELILTHFLVQKFTKNPFCIVIFSINIANYCLTSYGNYNINKLWKR